MLNADPDSWQKLFEGSDFTDVRVFYKPSLVLQDGESLLLFDLLLLALLDIGLKLPHGVSYRWQRSDRPDNKETAQSLCAAIWFLDDDDQEATRFVNVADRFNLSVSAVRRAVVAQYEGKYRVSAALAALMARWKVATAKHPFAGAAHCRLCKNRSLYRAWRASHPGVRGRHDSIFKSLEAPV